MRWDRHPLRAVTPPVQSDHIKQIQKVTESQQLRHHDTAKIYLQLPCSHFRPFPSSRLQTAECLRPEENFQFLVTGVVILPSWLPQHFDGLSEQTRVTRSVAQKEAFRFGARCRAQTWRRSVRQTKRFRNSSHRTQERVTSAEHEWCISPTFNTVS